MDPTSLLLAALVVVLVVLLYLQQRRHERNLADVIRASRHERAQLIDKITAPQRPMVDRPTPVVKQRRTREQQRDFARVGTVAAPREPAPEGEGE